MRREISTMKLGLFCILAVRILAIEPLNAQQRGTHFAYGLCLPGLYGCSYSESEEISALFTPSEMTINSYFPQEIGLGRVVFPQILARSSWPLAVDFTLENRGFLVISLKNAAGSDPVLFRSFAEAGKRTIQHFNIPSEIDHEDSPSVPRRMELKVTAFGIESDGSQINNFELHGVAVGAGVASIGVADVDFLGGESQGDDVVFQYRPLADFDYVIARFFLVDKIDGIKRKIFVGSSKPLKFVRRDGGLIMGRWNRRSEAGVLITGMLTFQICAEREGVDGGWLFGVVNSSKEIR